MLHPKKESSFDTTLEKVEDAKKQVAFESDNKVSLQKSSSSNPVQVHDNSKAEEISTQEQYSIATGQERRQIKPPQRYKDMVAYALSVAEETVDTSELSKHTEAISSAGSDRWLVAMNEEIESLHKNHTWEFMKSPEEKKIVGCKCIFKRKEGTLGIEDARYKARLVAKGYSQVQGVDFNDIFSPVVKHSSIRILLSLVATYDMELEQLDVKTEFLHGKFEEQIYMRQLEGR